MPSSALKLIVKEAVVHLDRDRLSLALLGAVGVVFVASACSSGRRPVDEGDADGDTDADHGADADGDADSDSDADGGSDAESDADRDVDRPELPYVPQCGNGVMDPGEECDDRNRLDGDGCTWECRVGDGDPPPAPDPSTEPYSVDGDQVVVVDDADIVMPGTDQLPLTWNGEEFATVLYERRDAEGHKRVRFFRFDRDGNQLDLPWTYASTDRWRAGLDLVWTGSGYGLFYGETDVGLFFLPLDVHGKPTGDAVLIEPDPGARFPSADLTADGFVVAWWASRGSGRCSLSDDPGTTQLRLIGRDGSTSGPPTLVDDYSGGPPDVATGDDGFGVVAMVNPREVLESCSERFVRFSPDLSERTMSGVLSWGEGGDVKWTDGHYVVGWPSRSDPNLGTDALCVARFSPSGVMVAAPFCNPLEAAFDLSATYGTRLAAGGGGLALLAESVMTLFFLRTDPLGVAVGAPAQVVREDDVYESWADAFNVVWADDAFAVLFVAPRLSGPGGMTSGLVLRWLRAVE